MKKTVIIIATLLASTTFGTAAAQEKVSFGMRLNGTLTNVKLSDLQGSDAKFHAGASLGGFVKIPFTQVFSLQPELRVSYTEAKVTGDYQRLKYKYAGFEIPVYLQAGIQAGAGRVIVGIGPHIGYGLSADTRIEQLPQGHPGENKIELDHWYAGAGVTVGYEFRNRLSINTGYQLGFDFSSRHKSSGITTQTISLGIGYRF